MKGAAMRRFNSTIVRLKDSPELGVMDFEYKFQFYDSTIKRQHIYQNVQL